MITEAGFGSDLGFEKFMHIKARQSGLIPHAVVLVASVRALKWHGGMNRRNLAQPDPEAVLKGGPNLAHHVGIVRGFGLPVVVVAINRFGSDSAEEVAAVREIALEAGANAAVEAAGYAEGGAGMTDLAEVLTQVAGEPAEVTYAYPADASAEDKVLALAQKDLPRRQRKLDPGSPAPTAPLRGPGLGATCPSAWPKTHLSTSHDPHPAGQPFRLHLPHHRHPSLGRGPASSTRWPGASRPCRACPPAPGLGRWT